MMPGIRHQRTGVNLSGTDSCILIHGFFHQNRDKGRHKGQHPRHCQGIHITACNLSYRRSSYAQAGSGKNSGQYYSRHTLQSLMPIGMVFIGISPGYSDSYDNHYGTEHIRCRMNGIGNHRTGMCDHTGRKLKHCQYKVGYDTDCRHPHCRLFKILLYFHIITLPFYVSF